MSNNNLLNQLRQRGINFSLEGSTIKLSPTEQITEKVRCWLIQHKDPLLILIKKEQEQLRKLIENVGRHDNWSHEEIEEMFEFATRHIGLDVAISSYKVTAARQAHVISFNGNKPVFCKTCQKHILLSEEHPYETLTCPICEKGVNSCLKNYYI